MTDSLAVLLVVDIPADAELVERELRLAGLGVSCRRVGPRPELEVPLGQGYLLWRPMPADG